MVDTRFLKVKCKDCGSEQVLFERASTKVTCEVCSATLATPTGGRADVKGEVLEELR